VYNSRLSGRTVSSSIPEDQPGTGTLGGRLVQLSSTTTVLQLEAKSSGRSNGCLPTRLEPVPTVVVSQEVKVVLVAPAY